nr:putative integron gene cassette protein [uncultured bacterium]
MLSSHEQKVRSALRLTAIFTSASFIVMLLLFVCYAMESPHVSNLFSVWGGATTAIFALAAQNRHNHFEALLVSNTFSTPEFNSVLVKYRKYQSIGSWIFLVLAILGIVIGALGSITK